MSELSIQFEYPLFRLCRAGGDRRAVVLEVGGSLHLSLFTSQLASEDYVQCLDFACDLLPLPNPRSLLEFALYPPGEPQFETTPYIVVVDPISPELGGVMELSRKSMLHQLQVVLGNERE